MPRQQRDKKAEEKRLRDTWRETAREREGEREGGRGIGEEGWRGGGLRVRESS